MPHPDLALELLAFLQRRKPRSLFPLGSIRIADLPEHLRSDDLVNYCQHHSLVELSRIPEDAPDYSPKTAGWRLSIGAKGAADLAEGRLTDRMGTADEAAVAAAPARSPTPPPGPIRSETRSMTSTDARYLAFELWKLLRTGECFSDLRRRYDTFRSLRDGGGTSSTQYARRHRRVMRLGRTLNRALNVLGERIRRCRQKVNGLAAGPHAAEPWRTDARRLLAPALTDLTDAIQRTMEVHPESGAGPTHTEILGALDRHETDIRECGQFLSDVATAHRGNAQAYDPYGGSRPFLVDTGQLIIQLSDELQEALGAADVCGVLVVLARSIEMWAASLKRGLFDFFGDSYDDPFQRALIGNVGPMYPGFVLMPFVGAPQAYDHVELAIGEEQANALGKRIAELEERRRQFGDAVAELASRWPDRKDVETLARLHEHRSALRRAAFDVCGYIRTLIRLIQSGAVGPQNAPPPQAAVDVQAVQSVTAIGEQSRELRAEQLTGSHPGDDLLRFLSERPDEMAAVIELPKRLQDPDMLTVSDADGLIEFGTRRHCWVGPVGKSELRVEKGWDYGSITGPNRKPMDEILAEALTSTDDERIRLHVRLTARGRVRIARLKTDRMATVVEPKTKSSETNWRDVQRRLYEMYERGDVWPKYDELERRLVCSRATIRKAIKPPDGALNQLDEDERKKAASIGKKLAGWQARHTKTRGAPRATSLTKIVLDTTAQTREVDPTESVTLDDPEEVLAHLIQDAEPEVRAKLNAITSKDVQDMTGDQVRKLVDMIHNDPDNYNRVLGRRP